MKLHTCMHTDLHDNMIQSAVLQSLSCNLNKTAPLCFLRLGSHSAHMLLSENRGYKICNLMFVSSLKYVFILFEDFYHSNYQDNIIYEGIVGEIRGFIKFCTGLFGPLFSQTDTGLSNEAVWGGMWLQRLFPCAEGSKGSALAKRALRQQATAAIIGEKPCKTVQGRPRTA